MFYFRIRMSKATKASHGGRRTSTMTEFVEALKPEYIGEKVAALLTERNVRRVTVDPISQAQYVRATRPSQ